MIATLSGGVLAAVLFLMYLKVGRSSISLSGLSSALTSLRMFSIGYYIDMLLILLLVLGTAYRLFYLKDIKLITKLLCVCQVLALIIGVFCFKGIRAVYALASGDFSTALAYGSGIGNTGLLLMLMFLAQIIGAGIVIYFRHNLKMEILDEEDTYNHGIDTDSSKNSKIGEQFLKGSSKKINYLATPSGKKMTKVTIIAVCIFLIAIIGFKIYRSNKKTTVDLTASCDYEFSGVTGSGKVNFNCRKGFTDADDNVKDFMRKVYYTVDDASNLKNGDNITIEAHYLESEAEEYKIEVKNPKRKIKVKGLEPAYPTYTEVPKELTDKFNDATREALDYSIKNDDFRYLKGITVEPDLLATYYAYSTFDHAGRAYYIYRAKVTGDDNYYTNIKYTYYEVSVKNLKPNQNIDLSKTSSDIEVNKIYISDSEKSDIRVLKQFKDSYHNLEVVTENATSDEIYKDEMTKKKG